MSFDLDIVRKAVIAKLNLSVRDTSGVATYSTTTGDKSFPDEELIRGCQSATTEIMRAICETPGHAHRTLFVTATALTHAAVIPSHTGPPGVPRITPYSGASYTLTGKRKSVEEIQAYRVNPGNLYSLVAHNVANGSFPSKLAGFYAIDPETQVIYFTGYSAVADLAVFVESNYTLIPDLYYPSAIALAIAHLLKDGDASGIFGQYAQIADAALQSIRAGRVEQPSMDTVTGARDSGAK